MIRHLQRLPLQQSDRESHGFARALLNKKPSSRLLEEFAEIVAARCTANAAKGSESIRIALQCVHEPLYFGLFAGMLQVLRQFRGVDAEIVSTRSLEGIIGHGWRELVVRSTPVVAAEAAQWARVWEEVGVPPGYSSSDFNLAGFVPDRLLARRLHSEICRRSDPENIEVDGILIGDLVIDTYLRFRPSPQFHPEDPFVFTCLLRAVSDIRRAKKYFACRRPHFYFTSFSTYVMHGVPVRVALAQGTRVLSFGNFMQFGRELRDGDVLHTPDCSGYRSGFAELADPDAAIEQARRMLEGRLRGALDPGLRFMKSSPYASQKVSAEADARGAAVVFLHDFYDSPHVFPDFIFSDFWEWLCFTIEQFEAVGQTYLLKPHPNQGSLSSGVLQDVQRRFPSARWLPTTANNASLVEAGIVCGITAYGTVAHELAYLGVPSISCARHPHYTFDFCRTARTKAEYADLLKRAKEPFDDVERMRRQALAFYYMHNLDGPQSARVLARRFTDLYFAAGAGESTAACNALKDLLDGPEFAQFCRERLRSGQDQRQRNIQVSA